MHEEILGASLGPILAKNIGIAEDLGCGDDDSKGLVLTNERGNTCGNVRLGREPAADTQCVAYLFLAVYDMLDGGQGNIVNLGVVAPKWAARDRDLELAGKIKESIVGRERPGHFNSERRGIDELIMID